MNAQTILNIVGYATAGLVLLIGIVILSDVFISFDYIPSNFRITMGIVLVLYGTYRIVMLWVKHRNAEKLEE